MRTRTIFLTFTLLLSSLSWAEAKGTSTATSTPASNPGAEPQQIEITADKTLEWYQDKNMYVARGNAKAVRGDMTVNADMLTAHEREKPTTEQSQNGSKASDNKKSSGSGDIDKMTAEGNVVITKANTRVTGDHAVNDVDKHVMVITGNNLRYETDKQVVTARDSLEYWDETKIAVARGHAVAIKGDRHVEGDVLTAEFRAQPNGADQLYKMTALGNVIVVTKNDVTRGDRAVYDAGRDIAIITGNVRITRADGTQLTGDVGESDFSANQSRLMNSGSGRVRALLPAKTTSQATKSNSTSGVTP